MRYKNLDPVNSCNYHNDAPKLKKQLLQLGRQFLAKRRLV